MRHLLGPRVRAWLAAFASARQLLWMLVLVAATGILLLVPPLSSFDWPPDWDRAFRGVHAAASFLLVIGSLAHAALRIAAAPITPHALVTGAVAATVFGFGAVTGAAAASPEAWASWLRAPVDSIRHAGSIVHFGYAGALAFATAYWHVRGRRSWLFPRVDIATMALLFLATVLGVASAVQPGTNAWTTLLAPPVAGLVAWTMLVPNVAWAWWPAARRRATLGGP